MNDNVFSYPLINAIQSRGGQRHAKPQAALQIFAQALPTFATHIFSRRHFYTNIEICQFCALHWTKIAFFCLLDETKNVKNAFPAGAAEGNSRRSPDDWLKDTPPHTSPHSALRSLGLRRSPLGALILVPPAQAWYPSAALRLAIRP